MQIAKDGEIEKLSAEVKEMHNSKRQLMQVVEHKELELREKNATIKSYLDKIVSDLVLVFLYLLAQ